MKSFLANRKSLLALTALLALVGGVLWQRTALVTWYSLRQLAAADEANRGERAERAKSHGHVVHRARPRDRQGPREGRDDEKRERDEGRSGDLLWGIARLKETACGTEAPAPRRPDQSDCSWLVITAARGTNYCACRR